MEVQSVAPNSVQQEWAEQKARVLDEYDDAIVFGIGTLLQELSHRVLNIIRKAPAGFSEPRELLLYDLPAPSRPVVLGGVHYTRLFLSKLEITQHTSAQSTATSELVLAGEGRSPRYFVDASCFGFSDERRHIALSDTLRSSWRL